MLFTQLFSVYFKWRVGWGGVQMEFGRYPRPCDLGRSGTRRRPLALLVLECNTKTANLPRHILMTGSQGETRTGMRLSAPWAIIL